MRRRRSILALGLGVAARAIAGCSSDESQPAPASSAGLPPPAEVPASLRGVCVVPAPGALFELAAKRWDLPLVGSSWASFAVGALGLPITASEAFDLGAPVRAALFEQSAPASLAPALALPLRAPDRLIAVASLGASAPFRAEKDEALRGERLVPVTGDARLEIGVLQNHLVVGRPGVLALAAFMADASQPLFRAANEQPAGWVAGSVLAALLEAGVALADLAGRGLFEAALPLGELPAVIRAIPNVAFQTTFGEASASLRLLLPKTAELAASVASLTSGPLEPMLATDRDASIALALYQAEADRVTGAEWLGNALGALGLTSEPPEAVHEALVALARARGDGFQLAVERGPAGALAYGSCDLGDDDTARKALASLTKGVVEPPKNASLRVGIVDTRLTLIGEAVHVFVDREEPAKHRQTEPTARRLASLLLRVESGRLALATGADAVLALKKALRRRAEEGPAALADLPPVKAIVGAMPSHAALFAFFDPARWLGDERPSGDAARDRSACALALAVGSDDVALTFALEPLAARALARALQGIL